MKTPRPSAGRKEPLSALNQAGRGLARERRGAEMNMAGVRPADGAGAGDQSGINAGELRHADGAGAGDQSGINAGELRHADGAGAACPDIIADRILNADEEQEGMRADRFLADELGDLSRTRIQGLIDEGFVTMGGKKIKSSLKLAAGDALLVRIPAPELPDIKAENIPLDILYEDMDLLVVNKPKGMTVHPAPGSMTGTLVNAVLWHCGDSLSGINGILRPGIVHRIDKNTTGALIVCKNDAAHRCIAAQLKDHSITRRYRGIVVGAPREDSCVIAGNIGRDPRDRKKMAVVREGGKEAVTHVRVLERFAGYSLCEFRLETGRTHQIRVHMSHTGHPLLGDDVYGGRRPGFDLEGQTLHAGIIGFIHPTNHTYMEFEAPLPDYFKNLLDRLKGRDG